MSESVLKIYGKPYPLPIEEVLADLTGAESIMLEDYLGGWEHFSITRGTTRSVVVMAWLAKHHAGEEVELAEIESWRGLVFGDTIDVEEVESGPPAVAADAALESSPETSETNGAQVLERNTV